MGKIKELSNILSDPERLLEVIREELIEIRDAYGDDRRTEINQDHLDLQAEDLIPEEEVVVTLSHGGYAKAQPIDVYQAQRRGGRGRSATKVKDEDFVDKLFRSQYPRHDLVFLEPWQDVLVEGLPCATGEPRIARQADCEPFAAGRRRTD